MDMPDSCVKSDLPVKMAKDIKTFKHEGLEGLFRSIQLEKLRPSTGFRTCKKLLV